jgi:hypothetical protein
VRHGFTVVEMPVEYRPRKFGPSSFDTFQPAWQTLVETLRYRFAPAPRYAGHH